MAHSHGHIRSSYRSFLLALVDIRTALSGLANGRSNAIGSVTLTASATTTVVTDSNVSADSVIALMPTTATAVSADTLVYVSAVTDGTFTLTHDNNAAIDRTFKYSIQG